ncbi:Nucleotidyltransferase [Auriscalpium vulgare]|uniref:Nucleotidyltransferase n=1 Tax=Auriscalpium vulgare TaxID=40419 RepID=A0ACB8R1F8_9AGAM|nr:Nucleotidyltransferase [Auriscalpium vulgare]
MSTNTLLSRITMDGNPREPTAQPGRPEFVQGSSKPAWARKRKRAAGEDAVDVPPEKQPLHTPWLSDIGDLPCPGKEERLHREIVAFERYILPTPHEQRLRLSVTKRIENVLRRRFHDGDVCVYGSVSTGTCLPTGDIDIVVTTPSIQSPESKKSALFQLRSMLQRDGVAAGVQVNTHARVPVLNFVTTPATGAFNVDVTINGAEGVQAIALVKGYLASMPALRPLLLVLKALLEMHGLGSAATGGLSSYAATCMLISFLQLNPTKRPPDFVDKPLENEALGYLLIDFLQYYANDFPYDTSAVSVTEKALIPKEEKQWGKSILAVQCLIHEDNNIAKGTGKVRHIREVFKDAAVNLELAQSKQAENSILGKILGLPQEVNPPRNRHDELH